MRGLMILVVTLGLCACKRASDDKPSPSAGKQGVASGSDAAPARPRGVQVTPPVDLKTPPADAVKTPSGLIYKKLVDNETGARPSRNDVVLVNYTGWRPCSSWSAPTVVQVTSSV
jgi:peptidylprolyl isomerase